MKNLLRSEWYRLRHDKVFYVMLGISVVLGIYLGPGFLVGNINVMGCMGLPVFGHMMVAALAVPLLLCIPGIILLTDSLARATAYSALSAGYSRFQVFMVKAIVFFMVMVLSGTLFAFAGEASSGILVLLSGGTIIEPNTDVTKIVTYILRVLFLTPFITGAMYSVTVLFAVLFMNTAKTVAATLGAAFIGVVGSAPFFFTGTDPWFIPMFMEKIVATIVVSPMSLFTVFVVSLGYMVLFLGGGYFIFRCKELK